MQRIMYTEAIHVSRLKKMLNKKKPCDSCPAAYNFDDKNPPKIMWYVPNHKHNPCNICESFIKDNVKKEFIIENHLCRFSKCPCYKYVNAIELTHLAIKNWETKNKKEN